MFKIRSRPHTFPCVICGDKAPCRARNGCDHPNRIEMCEPCGNTCWWCRCDTPNDSEANACRNCGLGTNEQEDDSDYFEEGGTEEDAEDAVANDEQARTVA